ncbi:MAG: Asp-tRNA(Asn)/Glu-tRNA(Gln) amidotransferase subunit GatA [Sphingobacteriaceae bacterium]
MKSYSSLNAIKVDLAKGEITVNGLVSYYLNRIQEHQHLNAFNEVFDKEAILQASKIDLKIKAGTQGRLAGMVISIKDNIAYKNHALTVSSKILNGFISIYSSTVVERLLAADAIIIGRCNCDEFAMGASNETSYNGPVTNYADQSKVSGGSSGGSAVAVQADLCLASLGTDTGGSIRQPASFCGVIGLKPTYGRVSRHGIVAYASSFDQVGPITKSIEDAALILEVIAGYDGADSTASSVPVVAYSEHLTLNKKKRIAYMEEALSSSGVNQEIKDLLLKSIAKLREEGHVVEPISFKYLDYVVPAYYILTGAEASSNLARYDGVHYGYRSKNATDLELTYKKSRSEGFGKEVKRRIMIGTFVLSSGYYDDYYAKAQKVRRIIRDKTAEILESYDFMLMPTAPTPAFSLNENMSDPIVMYMADIFTVQASLAGIPAISLPIGNNSDNLPLGLQLLTKSFGEAELLAFSKYFLELPIN